MPVLLYNEKYEKHLTKHLAVAVLFLTAQHSTAQHNEILYLNSFPVSKKIPAYYKKIITCESGL